ncbi:MAG: class III extradiol ring-cleavage dioxygenase [Pseudomonadota bacterium]
MNALLPSLFVSHGAPTLAIEDCAARQFLIRLGQTLPRPDAIVVVSAHYETAIPEVTTNAFPSTVHDFTVFDNALYQIEYKVKGSPDLASEIADALRAAFDAAYTNADRGLDHGAWVPLRLMYPSAKIPVVQVSIQPQASVQHHVRLGEVLGQFRHRGVLILGSGSTTHNLEAFFSNRAHLEAPVPFWAREFSDWLQDRILAEDWESVLHAVERGPHGRRNHPTMDHILPLFVALGARRSNERQCRIHDSFSYGVLAMDAYGFGCESILEHIRETGLGIA